MKVSVIMFINNMQNTLDSSLNSIIKNIGIDDYECILVDGNSTDATQSMCLDYQRNNKKITYIRLNEYDEAKIWNAGLKYATGEYIYFIKGCTYLCENFINLGVNYLDKYTDINIYIRNHKQLNDDNTISNIYHYFEKLEIGPCLSMCIFRKSCINILFSEEPCVEPVFAGKIVFTNKYYYNQHNFDSFINYYHKKPFLHKFDIESRIDWIKYTQEKINNYKNKIGYETL